MEWLLGAGLISYLLVIAGCVFWFWMLVDCLTSQQEDKLVWFLVIFFLNLLGAILYYWLARKKRTG